MLLIGVVHLWVVMQGVRETGDLGVLWSLSTAPETLRGAGALVAGRVWVDGEWWRVAAAGLVHGSLPHLGLNLWSLAVVGSWAERAFGGLRLLTTLVVGSVAGCLGSLAWAEAPVALGASAGIVAVAGELLLARTAQNAPTSLSGLPARGLAGSLVLMVLMGFFLPVIAQAGHLGGLAMGVALGMRWCGGLAWRTASFALVVLGGALLGAAARAPLREGPYREFRGLRLLELKRYEDASRELAWALRADPGDPVLSNSVAYALALAGVELVEAERLARQAVAAEPERADYLDTLGWVHCRAGRVEEGIAALEQAADAAEREIPEIAEHLRDCPFVRAVPRETAPSP
jgi:membrane associated rhomboid family serine protease